MKRQVVTCLGQSLFWLAAASCMFLSRIYGYEVTVASLQELREKSVSPDGNEILYYCPGAEINDGMTVGKTVGMMLSPRGDQPLTISLTADIAFRNIFIAGNVSLVSNHQLALEGVGLNEWKGVERQTSHGDVMIRNSGLTTFSSCGFGSLALYESSHVRLSGRLRTSELTMQGGELFEIADLREQRENACLLRAENVVFDAVENLSASENTWHGPVIYVSHSSSERGLLLFRGIKRIVLGQNDFRTPWNGQALGVLVGDRISFSGNGEVVFRENSVNAPQLHALGEVRDEATASLTVSENKTFEVVANQIEVSDRQLSDVGILPFILSDKVMFRGNKLLRINDNQWNIVGGENVPADMRKSSNLVFADHVSILQHEQVEMCGNKGGGALVAGSEISVRENQSVVVRDNTRLQGTSVTCRGAFDAASLDISQNAQVVFAGNLFYDENGKAYLKSLNSGAGAEDKDSQFLCTRTGDASSRIAFYDPIEVYTGQVYGGTVGKVLQTISLGNITSEEDVARLIAENNLPVDMDALGISAPEKMTPPEAEEMVGDVRRMALVLNKDSQGQTGSGLILFSAEKVDAALAEAYSISEDTLKLGDAYERERFRSRLNKVDGNLILHDGTIQICHGAKMNVQGDVTIMANQSPSLTTLSVASSAMVQQDAGGKHSYVSTPSLMLGVFAEGKLQEHGSHTMTLHDRTTLELVLAEGAGAEVPIIDICGSLKLRGKHIPLKVRPGQGALLQGAYALLRVSDSMEFIDAEGKEVILTYSKETGRWMLGNTAYDESKLPWVQENSKLSWVGNTLFYNVKAFYWAAEDNVPHEWQIGMGAAEKTWLPSPVGAEGNYVNYDDGLTVYFLQGGEAHIASGICLKPQTITVGDRGGEGSFPSPSVVWTNHGSLEVESEVIVDEAALKIQCKPGSSVKTPQIKLESGQLQLEIEEGAQVDLSDTTLVWKGSGDALMQMTLLPGRTNSLLFGAKELATDEKGGMEFHSPSVGSRLLDLDMTPEEAQRCDFQHNGKRYPLYASGYYFYNAYAAMVKAGHAAPARESDTYDAPLIYKGDVYYVTRNRYMHLKLRGGEKTWQGTDYVAYDAEKIYYHQIPAIQRALEDDPAVGYAALSKEDKAVRLKEAYLKAGYLYDKMYCSLYTGLNLVNAFLDTYMPLANKNKIPLDSKGKLDARAYAEAFVYSNEDYIKSKEKKGKHNTKPAHVVSALLTGQMEGMGYLDGGMKKLYGGKPPFPGETWKICLVDMKNISPLFALEAGKIYDFSSDAKDDGKMNQDALFNLFDQTFGITRAASSENSLVSAPLVIGYRETNLRGRSGHVVTCWGCEVAELDGKKLISAVWVTDSDDVSSPDKGGLVKKDVVYGEDGRVYLIREDSAAGIASFLVSVTLLTDPADFPERLKEWRKLPGETSQESGSNSGASPEPAVVSPFDSPESSVVSPVAPRKEILMETSEALSELKGLSLAPPQNVTVVTSPNGTTEIFFQEEEAPIVAEPLPADQRARLISLLKVQGSPSSSPLSSGEASDTPERELLSRGLEIWSSRLLPQPLRQLMPILKMMK